jgi:hypothetical protein
VLDWIRQAKNSRFFFTCTVLVYVKLVAGTLQEEETTYTTGNGNHIFFFAKLYIMLYIVLHKGL